MLSEPACVAARPPAAAGARLLLQAWAVQPVRRADAHTRSSCRLLLNLTMCLHRSAPSRQGTKAEAQAVVDAAARAMSSDPQVLLAAWLAGCAALLLQRPCSSAGCRCRALDLTPPHHPPPAAAAAPSRLQVQAADVFAATLADLLAILEKATSGETGIHASGGFPRC